MFVFVLNWFVFVFLYTFMEQCKRDVACLFVCLFVCFIVCLFVCLFVHFPWHSRLTIDRNV